MNEALCWKNVTAWFRGRNRQGGDLHHNMSIHEKSSLTQPPPRLDTGVESGFRSAILAGFTMLLP